ncbi:MAG TPA: hypothetical protein VF244_02290, partial [Acidimicrobiales bacterium]
MTGMPSWLLPLLAGASAVAAAFAPGEATGWVPLDAVLRAALAAAVVLAAGVARPVWTLFLAAVGCIVLLQADSSVWFLPFVAA